MRVHRAIRRPDVIADVADRLVEPIAITRTFTAVFDMCRTLAKKDERIDDDLWEGLFYVGRRLEDDIDALRAALNGATQDDPLLGPEDRALVRDIAVSVANAPPLKPRRRKGQGQLEGLINRHAVKRLAEAGRTPAAPRRRRKA